MRVKIFEVVFIMFTISALLPTVSGIIHLWIGYKKNQILKQFGANKKPMNKDILWLFAPQLFGFILLADIIPSSNEALLSFLFGTVLLILTSMLIVLGSIHLYSLKLDYALRLNDLFKELPENHLLFKELFGHFTYASNDGQETIYFYIKHEYSLSQIAEIGKRFDEYVELTRMKNILPGIKDMSEKEIKQSQLLDKRIEELRQFLSANREIVSEMVTSEGEFKRLKYQSQTIKKLERLNLESAEPLIPIASNFPKHIDPAIHELRIIQGTPDISQEVKQQAKELEVKVEERLKEKQKLLSDEELIQSKFDAIKLYHSL